MASGCFHPGFADRVSIASDQRDPLCRQRPGLLRDPDGDGDPVRRMLDRSDAAIVLQQRATRRH